MFVIHLCRLLHHLHELVEINFSVSVGVDLGYGILDGVLADEAIEFVSLEQSDDLFIVDLAAIVPVEHVESCS